MKIYIFFYKHHVHPYKNFFDVIVGFHKTYAPSENNKFKFFQEFQYLVK